MNALLRLNPAEIKVLAFLATGDADFGHFSFRPICKYTRLNRAQVRRACRSLTRKGLASFASGCWTEDGEPAGSGYGATLAGRQAADQNLVDRYALRRWV